MWIRKGEENPLQFYFIHSPLLQPPGIPMVVEVAMESIVEQAVETPGTHEPSLCPEELWD